MATIEYVTSDGHLRDQRDGVTVRTNWDAESIQQAIDHFTPSFEKTQPLAVFAGLSRFSVDDMNVVVFWRRENLRKNRALYRAEHKWADQRRLRNQFVELNNFLLSRTGFVHRNQELDWVEVLKSFSMDSARYRQIWPPQVVPTLQR